MLHILQHTKIQLGILMLFAAAFFPSSSVVASHSMGADLTYTCKPDGTYDIQLTFYRDCDGIEEPDVADINIFSASCGISDAIVLTPDGPGIEISPLCADEIGNSTCNDGNLQGVQQFTYSANYTFPTSCTDWDISYGLCCRNESITNSVTPGVYNLYVNATLNNVEAPCNSSPQFSTYPVPYICANQLLEYNHGAIDADGDSLVYTLVDPQNDGNSSVPYIFPFTAEYPIATTTGVVDFDPLTGQISMTPDGTQIGIVAVLVEEYRDGVLIGTTVRDMQVVVINCSNVVPDVTPPDPTEVMGGALDGSVFSVCAGNTLSFDLSASDVDLMDTLTVLSNIATSIPGATITVTGINPVAIDFVWPTTFNDVGVHSFTITVSDGACPTPGRQIFGYDIIVPGVDITASDTTVCEIGTQMIQLEAFPVGGLGGGTYSWTPTTGLDNPNIPNPVATVSGPMVYVVDYDDGVCAVQDTIKIIYGGDVIASPDISNICPGESAQLLAEYISYVNPPPPACGLSQGACGSPTVTIPVGTDGTVTGTSGILGEAGSPYLGYYEDGRTQMLFLGSELVAAGLQPGLVSELSFNISTKNSSAPYNNFNIKISCTEFTELSGFIGGLSTVYNGTVTTSLGINNYVFDTPYEWDGASNLIVEICYDNGAFTNYDHVFYTATAYNSVVYGQADNNSGCGLTGSTTTTRRANITFGNCDVPPVVGDITYQWSPTDGLNDPTIPNPIATPATTTTYVVTANDTDCIWTDTVTVVVSLLDIAVTGLNPSCGGGSGSLNVTVNSGTSPYTYDWSGGLPSVANPMNVPPGTYTVTVTDDTGCANTGSATIEPSGNMLVEATAQDIDCNGNQTGSITLSITGGTAPYTFDWDNAPDVQNPTGLSPGTYCVTVSDSGTCIGTACATISEPSLLTISATPDDPTCGGNDGSVLVTAAGGTPGYLYSFEGGPFQPINNFTNLPAGTYTIAVSDANGCVTTDQVTLQPSSAPIIDDVTFVNPDCNSTNGSITIIASGGAAPLQYSIDNGGTFQTGATFPNLGSGTYPIVVIDADSCTTSSSITLTENDGPTIDAVVPVDENCGMSNGSITVTASGGITPFVYTINNGTPQGTGVFTDLPAGPYTIEVTDANGCTTVDQTTINNIPGPSIDNIIPTNPTCQNSNGQLEVIVSQGLPPYDYSLNGGTPQASNIFTGLGAGTYTIAVTDDNGCTITGTANLTEADLLSATAAQVSPISCFGGSDGSATVTTTGGTTPYQITWDNGETTPTATDLTGPVHSVMVTDANGCTATATVFIGSPTLLEITAITPTDPTCGMDNGQIEITATGGTPAYVYTINNGTPQSSNVFTGLSTGSYSIVVTDANGCAATGNVQLVEPNALGATAVQNNGVTCNGDVDGSATVTATGGMNPYAYLWDNAENTATATGLTGGAHTVVVTDGVGCMVTATVMISEPALLEASITVANDVLCNDDSNGAAAVTVTGGVVTYTYQWSNNETTPTATGLPAGTHTVTVTDRNNCTATATVQISQPSLLSATAVQDSPVSCFGESNGSATVISTGGTGIYTYEWDNLETTQTTSFLIAGVHFVTVTDANGCTATASVNIDEPTALLITTVDPTNPSCGQSNGQIEITATGGTTAYDYSINGGTAQASNIFTNLPAGNYDILVTDANGCTATDNVQLTEPSLLDATAVQDSQVECFGESNGIATCFATGGTPAYTYLWDNAENTATATGLSAGPHSVVVTDDIGCTATATVMITEPALLEASITVDNDVPCYDDSNGAATVIVTGGTAAYTYQWSNNEITPTATGLPAGMHAVTVTDQNNCTATATVQISQPSLFSATAVQDSPVSCFGEADGSATATPTGGTAPYVYDWDNAPDTQTVTILFGGVHTVTVTDSNGCVAIASVNIDEPTALLITTVDPTNPSCGQSNGQIEITATGGTTAYDYSINGGTAQASNIFTNLPAGNYDILVTDANGCTATDNVQLTEPSLLGATAVQDSPVECFGESNGIATCFATGGTPAYTYLWDNAENTATATGLSAGPHTVVVTDDIGCTATATVMITEPVELEITLINTQNPTCQASNGQLEVIVSGGTAGYVYSLNGAAPQGSNTFTGLDQGSYNILVTDANGCTASDMVTLQEADPLGVTAAQISGISCNGLSDGSATVTITGGTPAYSIIWDNTEVSATATGLSGGLHLVTVTDSNGCAATATVNIDEPAALMITNINAIDPTCGLANGSIEITATGGTAPLQYSIDNGATFQTSPIFTNLLPGSFPIIVVDANACQVTNQAILSDDGGPQITNVATTNPSCSLPNGIIAVSITGGEAPFQYSLNGGTPQGSNIFNGLIPGSYDVLVVDADGCEAMTSVILFDEPGPQIDSVATVDPTCGLDEGIITIFASSGTVPLQYSVDNGATFQAGNIFDNLAPDNYTVIVQDFNGCTASFIATINSSTAPVVTSINTTATTCDLNNGSLQILAGNGTPPLQYSINNGISYQAGNTFTGLADGVYEIDVLDAAGCAVSAQATVDASTTVSIDNFQNTQPTCGMNNGSIEVTASGGTLPYEYSLDGTNYQASNIFDDLAAGPYTIIVVDDNGCSTTGMTNLNPSSDIVIDNINVINGTCGDNEGIIDIDASGGILNYMYSNDNGATFQASSVFGNLPSGTYDIVVQDATGCTAAAQATVDNSFAPVIDFVNTTDPTSCGSTDGAIQVFSSLGVAPVEYSINNGMSYQASPIFTGLGANTYNVVAMDAAGCSDTLVVVLSDFNAPTIDLVDTVNPDCGDDNGSITVTVSGGNPNYEYSIDNGQIFQGSNTFEDLPAGSYIIIVEDFLGCQTSTIPILLINGGAPEIDNIFVQNTSCDEFNGTIEVVASGGTPPYEYSIDGGITYQQPATFTDLMPGTYTVAVQDFAACVVVDQVTIANNGDIQLDNIVATDPSSCNAEDGSLIITASGGQAPYEFSIDNGMTYQNNGFYSDLPSGTYIVVVSDVSGCMKTGTITLETYDTPSIDDVNTLLPSCGESNGSIEIIASGGSPNYEYSIDGGMTYQASNIFNNLDAGVYDIVVIDFYGCIVMETTTLNNAGAPVIDNINTVDPSCGNQDGSIQIIVSGGTTTYDYSIDNGVTFQVANLFENLGYGIYDIIVRDAEGCEESIQVTLNDFGAPMINNVDAVHPECNDADGSIEIFANGGAPPIQYSIDNGITFQSSPVFENLTANTYNIIVQDAADCQATWQLVLGAGGSPIIDQVTINDASCDVNDGSLEIIAIGGEAPYQYSIDNGTTTQGSNSFSGLAAGDYSLVVTDVNGCTSSRDITINSTSAAATTILTDGPTTFCAGGEVNLNAGANFDSYLWSNGAVTNVINVTTSGNYAVTVTDANGCTAVDAIDVLVAAPIELDAIDIEYVELGETVTLGVLFPDPTLTYEWEGSDGSTATGPTYDFEGLTQGDYVFIVTTTVGNCSVSDTLSFQVLDTSEWAMPNAFTPNGDGLNDTFGPEVGGSLTVIDFKIFNRWGELVHDNPGQAWDGTFRGKLQGQGVFVYTLTIENLEGTREAITGDVHLLH